MKESMKARRLQRKHQKKLQLTKLNLVSLMDIFTILVFFLMVNTSEVQVMQNNKAIELPKSVSKESAEDNLVITVTTKAVLLQGMKIISVDELKKIKNDAVTALTAELDYQMAKRGNVSAEELANGLAINIMADKTVPYILLKKIMQTSAAAGYSNISLAVSQVQLKEEPIENILKEGNSD